MESAGVYATIPATLKGSRTPWPEKLKLARAAWSSPRCLLPNKEQLLLDWACNSLSSYYSRKLVLDPGVATQLWAFLGEVLGSARVRGEGRPVSLRAPVAQMLVERLCELAGLRAEGAGAGADGAELETPSPATLLACFQDILRTPPLRTILAAKLELLARLLRALLTMACRSLLPPAPSASREEGARRGGAAPVSSSDSPSVASLLQVLSQTMALYAATQRQQVNPQRVFRLLTGQLLGPAIVLRHLLLSEGGIAALGAAQEPPPTLPRDPSAGEAHAGTRAPVARDIRSRLEAAVAAALFHADLLPSYRDELLPPRPDAAGGSKERHRKSSSGLAPLRTILDVVSSPGVTGWDGASAADDVDPVPCGAVPLLYRQLLEAYGGSSDSAAMLCFRALRRMVAALGVEPGDAAAAVAGEEEAEGTGAASNIDALGSRHTLLALDQLLSAVAAADVYNVAVDRIQHGALQFAFYERLAAALLARPSPALPAWHRCLRSLLGLNHLILEPHLQALVSVAWLGPEPPEPRGRKARDALLCALLATYAKLRQLAKPLGAAFSSLCRDDDNGDDDGSPRGSPSRLVSAALGDKLSECLAELPAGQAADVWELALEAVRSRLPPPGAPARGGPRWARPLPSVALLLHAVLFRARSPDASWPAPAVARATRLMEATLREALAPLLLLCRAEGGAGGETAPALEAALTLAHTWAELDLCFQLNCPRYRSPGRDAGAGAATGAVAGGGAETINDGGDDGGDDGGFAANASVGTYDFRCLAPAVPARVWRELTRPLRRSGGGDGASGRARFLLATLSVRRCERCRCGAPTPVLAATPAACGAPPISPCGWLPWADGARQAPWDGELASVDEVSRAAAHWRLVLGHLPLLLPHLVPGDVQAVADAVTDAALASPDDEGAGDAGGATPRALAWALLRGPLLPELGAAQAAVVTALVARAAEALGAGDDDGARREGTPPSSLLPALARRDLPWAAEASAAARKAAYVRPHRDDGDVDAEDAPPARAATWALLDEVARGMLGRAAAGAEPSRLPPARLAALERVLDALAAQRLDAAPPGTAARCFLALFAVVSSVAPADEASLRLLTRCCRLLVALQRGGTGAAGAPRAVSPAETLEALARPLLRAGACACLLRSGGRDGAPARRAGAVPCRAARHRRPAPRPPRRSARRAGVLRVPAGAGRRRRVVPRSDAERQAAPTLRRRRAVLHAAGDGTAFLQAALADSAAARRRSYTTELDAVMAAAAAAVGGLLDADDSAGVDATDEKLELLVVPAAVLLEAELLAPGGDATEGLRHGAVYARVFERVARRLRSYEGGEDARRRVASHAGFLRLLLRGAAGERGGGVAEATAPALFSALVDLLAAPGVTREEFSALRPQLSALGAPLAAACGAEQLRVLLLELLGALSAQRLQGARTQEAVSALRLCQLLALADLEGGPCDAFWGAAPRFLSAIVTVTREAPRWLAGEAHAPVLAALDCAATLLARGGHWDVAATTAMTMTTAAEEEETPIESGPPPRGGAHGPRPVGPHGPAALAMQAVLAAPLERLTPARHHEMFHACHELLFAIMQMHPQVMLRAAPAFLGCFHKLVRSAMHEGRLRGDGDKGTGGGEAAELAASCAQTAERLYVQVAARIQEFPALAGFMAAQFVQELQKASLRAEVRRPLAEGAYAVLDLCREQDARVVAATLPSHGLRELFRQLQADHHKHHKYLSPRALALEPDEE
ncbi:LOW QUALITY PROTEIN: unhealthy ribosome biogenesis protein 2 homolog [Lethenteron reissneri]|uniref:LOW QUALITY PROTEIN: unhealthy ribosome biogenesis protein 2 homolog n=1 Tax=Lethenteron reissneri TaxID=7753 RepID=UPI002AB6F18D|nr:LOW QUALITY PROTEIN: unhealthy ribosome biogenesis protein 2 homolog [Lethenteron reissneri]